MQAAIALDEATVWAWLGAVPDPEIPVISVVDLGIVRAVAVQGDTVSVTITPTYSGCPAMAVIESVVREALLAQGVGSVHIATRLSPAWTTDWMSEAGKLKLRAYGIAPPAQRVALHGSLAAAVSRRTAPAPPIACPHCGAAHTVLASQFGSTPCKALYRCVACSEPFDYFKCH
jgi:ring-1,2-phenylacetyl-CoA epoxidase subunit PaaD